MSVLLGIAIIAGLLWWTARHFYAKGIAKSGHICASVERGSRYKPEVMKQVTLYCNQCHELIPSEVKVINKTHLPFPFVAELSDVDYSWHMETFHGKIEAEESK